MGLPCLRQLLLLLVLLAVHGTQHLEHVQEIITRSQLQQELEDQFLRPQHQLLMDQQPHLQLLQIRGMQLIRSQDVEEHDLVIHIQLEQSPLFVQ